MQNADYLQLLVDYIHSATLATIGEDANYRYDAMG